MTPGAFITIEGIEGAGKTTCMKVLVDRVTAQGIPVLQTREPGGTTLGEDLRELLLGHRHTGMADDTELLLMFAARAEHIQHKIRPALEQDQWVVCDRFTDATYAYQGAGRGISPERIGVLEQWVQGELRPDLTIVMDLPVEQGLERAGKRSAPDRFEREQAAFFERVRQGYLDIARRDPERVQVVDASPELEQVTASIQQVIDNFIRSRND